MISNFNIWVGCRLVEKFCESFGGVLGAGRLSRGEVAKGNKHGGVDDKGVEEEATDGLLNAVDTFGVKAGRFVRRNWLLNFGAIGD